jgi:cell division protein ZapA
MYKLGCEDGQEERLGALANHVSAKIDGLSEEFGQIDEPRLFLMCALMIADELFDARAGGSGRVRTRPSSVDTTGEPIARQPRSSSPKRERARPESPNRELESAATVVGSE